jgi:hypothetical protein
VPSTRMRRRPRDSNLHRCLVRVCGGDLKVIGVDSAIVSPVSLKVVLDFTTKDKGLGNQLQNFLIDPEP